MPTSTISILYVDDEAALLDIGRLFLERSGAFSVTTAESAHAALDLMEKARFDIIVSDYQMPVMDGIMFLKKVRQKSDIPFILFTGKGREEIVIEAINNGVDFYLQKGGDPTAQFTELAHKVRLAVERRRAEEALKDSERRLSDLINFLPDATFAIDGKGTVIAWNRAIEQMTEVPADRMLGKGDYEYAVPFYGERRPILVDLVLKENPEIEKKYPFIHRKDRSLVSELFIPLLNRGKGAYIWFIASPLYDNKGGIVGAIESLRDITDRTKAEDALRTAEEKFSTVFRSSPDMISISELDTGRFVDVNDAAFRIFGYERGEFIGKSSLDLGIWVNADDRTALVSKVLTQGRADRFETWQKKKNGEVFFASISAATITFSDTRYLITTIRDISELKRAERALKESEERYRTVVEGQTEFISRFTPDGIHVFANEAYLHYFGITREELIGHRFVPSLPPEDIELVRNHFASLVPGHPSATIEHRIIMPDGSVRWQQWSDTAIFTEEGRVIEYQSVGRDITLRKMAENQVQASEERYRSLAEASPDLIFVIDPDDRVSYINSAAARMLRLSVEHVIGMPRERLFLPDTSRHQRKLLDHVFSTGESVHSEGQLSFGGREYDFDHYLVPIHGADGRITAVLGISRDISERRRIERALRESEQKYRGVIENLEDVFYRVDMNGTIIMASPSVATVFGYGSVDEVIGLDLARDFYRDPAKRMDFLEEIYKTGSVKDYQAVLKKKDGTPVIVSTTAHVYHDADGNILGIEGVAKDITDWKHAETALKVSEEKFRTILDTTGEWIWDIDISGRHTYSNASCEAILGYRPDEILASDSFDLIHPEDRERISHLLKSSVMERKGWQSLVIRWRHKDGTYRYLESNATTLVNELGELIGFRGADRDITDRMDAEKALKDSEEKYRALVETSFDGIVIHQEGLVVYANMTAIRFLGGTSPDQVVGQPIISFVHPEYHDVVQQRAAAATVDFQPVLHEKFLRLDGGVIDVDVAGTPFVWKGKPAVHVVFRDITDRIRAEDSLWKSESRLGSIIRVAPIGIGVVADRIIRTVNDRLCSMTGYTSGELIGKSARVLYPTQEDFDYVGREKYAQISATGSGSVETRWQKKDGTIINILLSSTPIDQGDLSSGVTFTALDITSLKQAEAELTRARDWWETIFQAIGSPVMILDPDHRVIAANNALVAKAGKTLAEIRGMHCWEILHGPDATKPPENCPYEKMLASCRYEVSNMEIEAFGGTYLVSCTPVFDPAGRLTRVIHIATDISKRKQAEAELLKKSGELQASYEQITASEEELRQSYNELARHEKETRELNDSLPDIIYRADTSGNIVYMNKKGLELLEVSENEMFNQPFLLNLYPDDIPAGVAVYRHLLKTGEPVYNFECRFVARRGKGRVFPVIQNVSVVRNENGVIVGTQGIALDISDKKRAENALKESEARLRSIIEHVPGILWTLDSNLTFTSSYGAALRDIGLQPNQVVGMSLDTYYNAQPDREQAKDAHRRALNGETVTYEARYGDRSFIAHIEPLRDPDLTITGTLGIAYDVTEMQQAQEAIRQSEELHRSLVSASPDGICITSREGIIAYVSPRAIRLFGGNRPEDAIGQSIFDWIAPEDRDRALEDLKKVMGGMPFSASAYTAVRRDGSSFMAEVSIAVIRDASGGISGMVASIRDISDRVGSQEALRLANTKLNLLSSITRHDILNKLMVIEGYTALIRDTADPRQARAYLEKINASAEVIKNILFFTRDYQSMGVHSPEWLDAGRVFSRQLEEFELRTVAVQNNMFGVQIYADPLFEKVMYNIIENSLRYGQNLSQVIAAYSEQGEELVCTIEDDGGGIPDSEKERIFERGVGKGTGLGLFLAREILSVTGMTIQETGEPGRGARFEIRVPKGKYRIG